MAFRALVLVAVLPVVAFAQKPGDEMIDKYLAGEAERLGKRVLDGATTRAEWEQKLPRLRQEYMDMLGLSPPPERTPLHATITGTVERDKEAVVIDKLHFQSKPGLYVTGNLYRPRTPESAKLPAVLYVCGHSGRGRDGNKTAFQDHGVWCATHGYICLIIDTLQLGEIPGIHHGTYREGRWWWQALGYTPAGVECWNGIRAIDYLVSRPDVDAERIAVTGISGGGAATFWISAADERVKCAVPVSGMSDLQTYVTDKVINGHCDCMFLVNSYQWEWTTIASLIAPRPLLFANSDNDKIFPMDGNRRIIARLRHLYELYGKPQLVDEYISKGGHDDRPDLRVAAFRWINKHLKGGTVEVTEKDVVFPPLPGKELRVFPEDRDVPKDALNGKIDETFVTRAPVTLREAGSFDEWKNRSLRTLRTWVLRHLPYEVPAAKRSDKRPSEIWDRPYVTEPNIDVSIGLIQESRKEGTASSLVVLNSSDTDGFPGTLLWCQPYIGEGAGHYFLPRGVGNAWTQKSPPNYVERAHALLGHTVDEGRLFDVLSILKTLNAEAKGKPRWKIMGRGQAGILAAYAALLEPSIAEVVIADPPVSHREGPIFLNVLRYLDIPEALGLLAPRPLTLIGAKDAAFERTAEIYKLAGAADKLQRK